MPITQALRLSSLRATLQLRHGTRDPGGATETAASLCTGQQSGTPVGTQQSVRELETPLSHQGQRFPGLRLDPSCSLPGALAPSSDFAGSLIPALR